MARCLPQVIFFNINGSGLGHMNRCLAYARAMQDRAAITFFSLASACEIIESFDFMAEYFISPFWSQNNSFTWNMELAYRFSLTLNHVQPDVVVFDGTWPFQGFLSACASYTKPLKKIWSKRGLLKGGVKQCPVPETDFDAILSPGEVDTDYAETKLSRRTTRFTVPPVTLLQNHDLYSKELAREELKLAAGKKYVLFSLGPGNLKDVTSVGYTLITLFREQGYEIVWAQAPISVKDVPLPDGVQPLKVYPLVKYMKAFDVFVGAAGYNTCCEVVQTQVPSLIVPNTLLADDQARRAHLIAEYAPVIVSACATEAETKQAVDNVLVLAASAPGHYKTTLLNGAGYAAKAILRVAES